MKNKIIVSLIIFLAGCTSPSSTPQSPASSSTHFASHYTGHINGYEVRLSLFRDSVEAVRLNGIDTSLLETIFDVAAYSGTVKAGDGHGIVLAKDSAAPYPHDLSEIVFGIPGLMNITDIFVINNYDTLWQWRGQYGMHPLFIKD